MRIRHILVAAVAATALIYSAEARAEDGRAELKGLDGQTLGSVAITQTPSGYARITISAKGLSQGWHGFHIHETGTCDAENGFKGAGGHLAGGKGHGFLTEGGPHPGDLPNQMVNEDGILVAEVFNNRLNLSAEGTAALFDDDGSAVILHAGADDYESQPAGAAGDRIACGVIEKR